MTTSKQLHRRVVKAENKKLLEDEKVAKLAEKAQPTLADV